MVAQASSFVAVLVIGAFMVHSPPGHHSPPPSIPSSSPRVSSASPPPAAPVPELGLTVQAHLKGKLLPGKHRVTVLQAGTLTSAGTSYVTAGVGTVQVPSGSYEVCLSAPGLRSASARSASTLPGWICKAARVQAGVGPVTFQLMEVPS
jgi:hypothetical protein